MTQVNFPNSSTPTDDDAVEQSRHFRPSIKIVSQLLLSFRQQQTYILYAPHIYNKTRCNIDSCLWLPDGAHICMQKTIKINLNVCICYVMNIALCHAHNASLFLNVSGFLHLLFPLVFKKKIMLCFFVLIADFCC